MKSGSVTKSTRTRAMHNASSVEELATVPDDISIMESAAVEEAAVVVCLQQIQLGSLRLGCLFQKVLSSAGLD